MVKNKKLTQFVILLAPVMLCSCISWIPLYFCCSWIIIQTNDAPVDIDNQLAHQIWKVLLTPTFSRVELFTNLDYSFMITKNQFLSLA